MVARKQDKTKEQKRRLKAIKELERTRQAISASRERLMEGVKERISQTGRAVRFDFSNQVKMSEVILDFAQPLLDAAQTDVEQFKAIELAIMVWNISMLPEINQKKRIEEIKAVTFVGNQADWKEDDEVFTYLLQRRKSFYSGINRIIMDYDIIETPQGFHLNVVSNIIRDRQP